MQPSTIALVLLVVAAAPALIDASRFKRASPYAVGDQSDKKFMKRDYPDDSRPEVTKYHTQYDFTHPFPQLQEDSKYDDDFVSDENNDGGDWKAQEEYDRLRIKIAKVKAEMDRLKVRLKEEESELQDAIDNEKEAEVASKKAEEKADRLKKLADEAQDKLERLNAGRMEKAEDGMKEEMSDLEKCKKELAKAKAELEKLLKAKKNAKSDIEAAKAKRDDTEEIAEDAEKLEKDLEEEVKEERAEYEHAKKEYEQDLKEVEKIEAQLERAAAKLRKYRRHNDADGGVYYVPGPDGGPTEKPAQNSASSLSQNPALLAVALLMSAMYAIELA